MPDTLYDRLGGEPKLRVIVDDFVERVFADVMIGFFFRDAQKPRIKELEFQHAAEFLGGPVTYRGRSLREAHAKHPIMGGHFARRLQILRDVLAAHGAPLDVAQAWVQHNEGLRGEITDNPHGECIDR